MMRSAPAVCLVVASSETLNGMPVPSTLQAELSQQRAELETCRKRLIAAEQAQSDALNEAQALQQRVQEMALKVR